MGKGIHHHDMMLSDMHTYIYIYSCIYIIHLHTYIYIQNGTHYRVKTISGKRTKSAPFLRRNGCVLPSIYTYIVHTHVHYVINSKGAPRHSQKVGRVGGLSIPRPSTGLVGLRGNRAFPTSGRDV